MFRNDNKNGNIMLPNSKSTSTSSSSSTSSLLSFTTTTCNNNNNTNTINNNDNNTQIEQEQRKVVDNHVTINESNNKDNLNPCNHQQEQQDKQEQHLNRIKHSTKQKIQQQSPLLLRILCLHDHESNGYEFKEKILSIVGNRLYEKHHIDFIYMNSPLLLQQHTHENVSEEDNKNNSNNNNHDNGKMNDLNQGEQKEQQQHTWWYDDNNNNNTNTIYNNTNSSERKNEETNKNVSSDRHYYSGLDASLFLVRQIWNSSTIPFWGIIGIGQGATVASLFLLSLTMQYQNQQQEQISTTTGSSAGTAPPLQLLLVPPQLAIFIDGYTLFHDVKDEVLISYEQNNIAILHVVTTNHLGKKGTEVAAATTTISSLHQQEQSTKDKMIISETRNIVVSCPVGDDNPSNTHGRDSIQQHDRTHVFVDKNKNDSVSSSFTHSNNKDLMITTGTRIEDTDDSCCCISFDDDNNNNNNNNKKRITMGELFRFQFSGLVHYLDQKQQNNGIGSSVSSSSSVPLKSNTNNKTTSYLSILDMNVIGRFIIEQKRMLLHVPSSEIPPPQLKPLSIGDAANPSTTNINDKNNNDLEKQSSDNKNNQNNNKNHDDSNHMNQDDELKIQENETTAITRPIFEDGTIETSSLPLPSTVVTETNTVSVPKNHRLEMMELQTRLNVLEIQATQYIQEHIMQNPPKALMAIIQPNHAIIPTLLPKQLQQIDQQKNIPPPPSTFTDEDGS